MTDGNVLDQGRGSGDRGKWMDSRNILKVESKILYVGKKREKRGEIECDSQVSGFSAWVENKITEMNETGGTVFRPGMR